MSSKPGLTKEEGTFFVKAFGGQDTSTTDLSLSDKGDIAQNCRFADRVGAISKRDPIAYYNTTAESYPMQSIYRYYKKLDNTQYLIQINGTTLRVGNDSTGTFSTLATLTSSSGRRFSAVTYNDLTIISTGYDNIIQTDGLVAWELGSCKAGTPTSGGSLDASATYSYQIVFNTNVNGTSGTNTVTGAVSNTVTTTSSNRTIPLTNIPIGPDGTQSRAIYRTEGGGASYYLVHVIGDNSTTSYIDNNADTTATALPAVTDDMPKGAYLYIAQERLFVAGDPLYPNTVYYSDQYLPHSIRTASTNLATMPASDHYDFISKNDNDQITGIKGHLGITYVFKQNSIRPYYVEGTPDTWKLGDPLSVQGCPAPYSIVNTPYGITYQGWDHWYLFNGNFSQPIIDEFPVMLEVSKSRLMHTFAEYHKTLLMASYTDAALGHQYNDKILVYDLLRKQLSIDKGGTKETAINPITGTVNVNCFCSAKGGSDEGQLYAGDAVLGFVYKYDRAPNTVQYSTTTDLNTGTFADTGVGGTENTPILTREFLDDMEPYSTDALAQSAWVTSETSPSKKVPPDLGTGLDGAVTISSDTSISGTYNYTSLTINSGKTLTVTDATTIKCLGTVYISGAITSGTNSLHIFAQTVTIVSGGSLSGNIHVRCNTLNNAGTLQSANLVRIATTSHSGTDSNGYSYDGNFSNYYYISCSGDNASASGYVIHALGATETITKFTFRVRAYAHTTAGASSNIASSSVKLQTSTNGTSYTDVPGGTYTAYAVGNQTTDNDSGVVNLTGSWSSLYIKVDMWCIADKECNPACGGDQDSASYAYEIEAYKAIECDYVNSSGTVPTSGSVTDYANALDCFTETAIKYQGDRSLKLVVPPGSDTLNKYFTKTVPSTNLSDPTHDIILIDVYALRSGTNFQFGMGESAATDNLLNVTVDASNTWQTVALDFSGVSDSNKDAITKIGIKFTNTDSGNIVFIDNIRPALSTATWTSPVLNINAGTLGNMYWNETLGVYGDVQVYTRNGTLANIGSAAWSTPLTSPTGSAIISTGCSTNPADLAYFQFKVVFTSTDSSHNYAEFPSCSKVGGYVVKMDYYKTASSVESSVEFIYRTGYKNFDEPFTDKTFKKIVSVHEGSEGLFDLAYDIDYEAGTSYGYTVGDRFKNIPLATYPKRWECFFPATAYGREIRFRYYKNDMYGFKIKQIAVLVNKEPVI